MTYQNHLNATAAQSLSSFTPNEVSPKDKPRKWFPPKGNKNHAVRPVRQGNTPYFRCEGPCGQLLPLEDLANYKLSPLYAHRLQVTHKFDDPSRTICVECASLGEHTPIER